MKAMLKEDGGEVNEIEHSMYATAFFKMVFRESILVQMLSLDCELSSSYFYTNRNHQSSNIDMVVKSLQISHHCEIANFVSPSTLLSSLPSRVHWNPSNNGLVWPAIPQFVTLGSKVLALRPLPSLWQKLNSSLTNFLAPLLRHQSMTQ
jgi:hypothetical protein